MPINSKDGLTALRLTAGDRNWLTALLFEVRAIAELVISNKATKLVDAAKRRKIFLNINLHIKFVLREYIQVILNCFLKI